MKQFILKWLFGLAWGGFATGVFYVVTTTSDSAFVPNWVSLFGVAAISWVVGKESDGGSK